jgi:hypothetical protein
MKEIFESYSDDANLKDGGFIFQAILNYDLSWSIVDGRVELDQKNIQGWLKQVDVFPDMQFSEGYATLTYVILSEVNLLKRKFELASEAIKRLINSDYAKEMDGEDLLNPENQEKIDDTPTDDIKQLPEPQKQLPEPQKRLPEPQKQLPSQVNEVLYSTKLTSDQIKEVNDKYFKGTSYSVRFTADNIVLREVSTSGLDSGAPNVTLKLSTGMVDTLDSNPINSWDNFKVVVGSLDNTIVITNRSEPKISEILVYDPVENVNDLIFRTILPSLVLEFRGDRVKIDNYANRSTQVSIRSTIDFDNLFNIEEAPKAIEEPEEGENLEEPIETQKKPSTNNDFINGEQNK